MHCKSSAQPPADRCDSHKKRFRPDHYAAFAANAFAWYYSAVSNRECGGRVSRTLEQITVFVSGTSETESEKAALRRIVEELNRRLEKTHSVTLKVVGWPDDVRPGINVDLQAEINRQFGSDYDVYVGILGTRFGTPTPRAGSGTEEEFEGAVTRFQSDSTLVRVFFYFRRSTEDSFALDLDQLQRVRRFREALPARGVLYRDFKDTADFANLVSDHLYNLVIEEWKGQHWSPVLPNDPGQSGAEPGSI